MSLLDSVFGGLFAAGQQRRQFKYDYILQKDAQNWSRKMWEDENFYNLPKNEIQRLLDAGVNPALAFTNGGATAAPVPPPSSASVGAPMPNISGIGTDELSAINNMRQTDANVKVAESTANKQNAEADATRAESGLTRQKTRLYDVYAEVAVANKDVYKKIPALDYNMKLITANLGYNKYIRDNIYTAGFPQENAMRLESMRLNNNLLRKEYDRLVALVDLERAKGRLTDAQVQSVFYQNDILFVQRYAAQFSYNMSRIINERVYGSADSPNPDSKIIFDIVERMKKDAANHLTDASVTAVSLNNDLHFEQDYGSSMRFYQYEGVRRGANKTRADMYYGLISSISGLASSAISAGTAGASIRYKNAATRALDSTNRSFGLTVPHYKGGNVYIPDIGGDLYNIH